MFLIVQGPLSPVTAAAQRMCEGTNKTVVVFEDENDLEDMLRLWPELKANAIALFTVPEVPAKHYACGRDRLKALGKEGLIPSWANRFDNGVAVQHLDQERLDQVAPSVAHALTAKLNLPVHKKRRRRKPGRRSRVRSGGHFACP